ncbi:MAG: acyl-CoA synthetase [Actinomycetota bacterium]
MFENVDPKFLPPPEHRPLLTFGHPSLHYGWSRPTFNAATELLDRSVARVGADHRAILHVTDGGVRTWSYGDLAGAVSRLANGLRALGVSPGDRVLMRAGEVPEAAVIQLAVWKIGAIIVPAAVVEMARELVFMLNDTEAVAVVCESANAEELEKALPECPSVRWAIGWPEPIAGQGLTLDGVMSGQPDSCDAHPTRPLDGAGIFYTGGTTGRPKGCLHTHVAEVALADLNGWARGLDQQSVLLTHAPLGHAFGNGEKINFPLRAGASVVYASRPTPQTMWELIAEHRVTTLAGAATMYRMMLQACPEPGSAYPGIAVTTALSSGEILDPRTFHSWREQLGIPLRNVVGMTPIRHLFIDSNQAGVKVAPGLSVGAPLPGYEARLVGEDGQPTIDPDAPGRLAIRGPSGITYWINEHPAIRDRAATDVRQGWSFLDDAYRRDEEGWLWFEGRLDDMIVTGGRQVAPIEVEEVLGNHPAVAEVAVVSAPDEVRGQVVAAFVCLQSGYDPSTELAKELQEHAKATMAGYKYPRRLEFVDTLPKDQVGKIQRRKLREQLAAEG